MSELFEVFVREQLANVARSTSKPRRLQRRVFFERTMEAREIQPRELPGEVLA